MYVLFVIEPTKYNTPLRISGKRHLNGGDESVVRASRGCDAPGASGRTLRTRAPSHAGCLLLHVSRRK